MSTRGDGPQGAAPVRFARLAEQVADDLRTRILIGDLADGSALPIEEVLRAQYPVSKPTLREAMRVLEAEGLVTVRRGAIGGAVVHRPTSEHVAYSLGLVLAGRRVAISDVAGALREVEPSCAAACARRPDRNEAVVPTLRMLHERSLKVVDDLVEVTTLSRMFHEAIVELCGNHSLAILAGALESVWSSHESDWAAAGAGGAPQADRPDRRGRRGGRPPYRVLPPGNLADLSGQRRGPGRGVPHSGARPLHRAHGPVR